MRHLNYQNWYTKRSQWFNHPQKIWRDIYYKRLILRQLNYLNLVANFIFGSSKKDLANFCLRRKVLQDRGRAAPAAPSQSGKDIFLVIYFPWISIEKKRSTDCQRSKENSSHVGSTRLVAKKRLYPEKKSWILLNYVKLLWPLMKIKVFPLFRCVLVSLL